MKTSAANTITSNRTDTDANHPFGKTLKAIEVQLKELDTNPLNYVTIASGKKIKQISEGELKRIAEQKNVAWDQGVYDAEVATTFRQDAVNYLHAAKIIKKLQKLQQQASNGVAQATDENTQSNNVTGSDDVQTAFHPGQSYIMSVPSEMIVPSISANGTIDYTGLHIMSASLTSDTKVSFNDARPYNVSVPPISASETASNYAGSKPLSPNEVSVASASKNSPKPFSPKTYLSFNEDGVAITSSNNSPKE